MAAEVKSTELENVQEAIKIWRETAVKLQERVDYLEREIAELKRNCAGCEFRK
jgi:polyhydroxyalkanoate synthesis regulator phasin